MDVNCLLKALAMSVLRVRVVELKVMGWLGGVWRRLPESVLRREKYCEVLFVGARLDCVYPCLSVSDLDILVYLFVERADVWVCGGEGSELVALSDE